ncbi:DsbA family oxidoreductase [Vagococcus xieshaowenii]|nr:DsbA family protein [Vagococcus xieshaowenii]
MSDLEIHIDFACPFSYLGGEKYLQFLEKNNQPLDKFRFRSFQLQPNDNNQNPSYLDNRMKGSNFNSKEEYISFFNNGIGKAANELGLHYDVEHIVSKNSINAHLGLQFAIEQGKQAEYFREVMAGHWEQGKDYFDITYIEGVLRSLNLDVESFHQHLEQYKQGVADDIMLANQRGIHSVPTFYKDRVLLNGTGSDDIFETF